MSSGRKIHIKISEISEQNPVKIDGTNKQKKTR
jgi:hypothetical protein